MTASLSARCASRGRCSQICRPGTVVGDRLELAAILGRGVGLQVPGVLLGRPAPHEQHDARHRARPNVAAASGRADRGGPRAGLEQGRQPQPEEAQLPAEHLAARRRPERWATLDRSHDAAPARRESGPADAGPHPPLNRIGPPPTSSAPIAVGPWRDPGPAGHARRRLLILRNAASSSTRALPSPPRRPPC